MKRLDTAFVLCVIAFACAMAGEDGPRGAIPRARLECIEQSIVAALQSDCPGLQTSAAITLLQVQKMAPSYGWNNAIIPLMRIVNGEHYATDARIAAALALHGLRTDRGDFSIVRNAKFASDQRVKRFCTMLAANRQHPANTPQE